jgi:hypothetical protein
MIKLTIATAQVSFIPPYLTSFFRLYSFNVPLYLIFKFILHEKMENLSPPNKKLYNSLIIEKN